MLSMTKGMSAKVLTTALLIAAVLARVTPAAASASNDPLMQAMESELSRSMQRLKLDDFDAPYFISYRLTEIQAVSMEASYGALVSSGGENYRGLVVDVRVGDYAQDNSTDDDSFYFNPRDTDAYRFSRSYAPIDNDTAALRHELWLITDYQYKSALEEYIAERGGQIQKIEKQDAPEDFSMVAPVTISEPIDSLSFDVKRWKNVLRAISARFKREELIYDSDIELRAIAQTRYLLTSEGTRLRTNDHNYSLSMSAHVRADDGMPIDLSYVVKTHDLASLPDSLSMAQSADSLSELLLSLREAPVMDPYTGPAIVLRGASGVFFHEALGHRLEGHRTRRESEGHTFKDKLGSRIIPEFLSVYDDPTRQYAAGVDLYGSYEFDDEGVPSQKAQLVSNGVLESFLMCRTPIHGIASSNGHGRGDIWHQPVSRMGSLFVESSSPITFNDLKSQLLDQCRRQGKEYGLVFEDIEAGETNTSSYGVQTLRVRPRVVKKVYVSDGREELVRGVELIGTPLAVLESIVAASDDLGVFNGVCGAESGWVPVSAVAPSVLISEVEVQRLDRNLKRGPILPPPLHSVDP